MRLVYTCSIDGEGPLLFTLCEIPSFLMEEKRLSSQASKSTSVVNL